MVQAEGLVEEQAKQSRLAKQDLHRQLEEAMAKAADSLAAAKKESQHTLEELRKKSHAELEQAQQEKKEQTRQDKHIAWLSFQLCLFPHAMFDSHLR